MKVVTTFHAPSSVVSSVKCRLEPRELDHLVIAKLNRVDVYSLQPHGLQHECGLEIWGKVICVKAVPVPGTTRSKLVLLLSHPDPEALFLRYEVFADGSTKLAVSHSLVLSERSARPSEFLNDLLVHPSGRLAIAHCYVGRIKVITLENGEYSEDFDVALPEYLPLSMAFLFTDDDECALAILHLDALEQIHLLARKLTLEDSGWELSESPSTILPATAINSKVFPNPTEAVPRLIPVPGQIQLDEGDEDEDEDGGGSYFLGGVLVAGGRKILLYEIASATKREKYEAKRAALEAKKSSRDKKKVKEAKEKQLERDMKKRKPTASVEWPWGDVTAHCAIADAPFRFFLGDTFGGLALLSVDNVKEDGLVLIPLGTTSPTTTLSYLSSQALYVGSHLGDSQIVIISGVPYSDPDQPTLSVPAGIKVFHKTSMSRTKGKARADDMDVDDDVQPGGSNGRIIAPDGSYVKVVQTFKNIGPILDASLVDVDGSGQYQLVTCSGGQNTGSLNVVRNGSEFEELAFIPGIVNLTGVWSAKSRYEDRHHNHIVVSTHSSTLLYQVKDAGQETSLRQINPAEARDLITRERTLAFANVLWRKKEGGKTVYRDSAMAVQVVPSGVYLFEYDEVMGGYTEKASFKPSDARTTRSPTEITAASVNASQIAIAFNAGVTAVLNITDTLDGFNWFAHREDPSFAEVSAISILPQDVERTNSALLAVSYWITNQVEVFKLGLGSLTSLAKSERLPALVRSLQFFNFAPESSSVRRAYLVCGLTNGSFAHFSWKDSTLGDKKVVSLGSAPVHLTIGEVENQKTMIAAGSRTTVISLGKDSLTHSPLMIKDLTAACRLNTNTFPDSVLLAGPNGLTIGRVQDLNKLNIRTIPMGYCNPRRIEYLPLLRAFAVASTQSERTRVGDPIPIKSNLKLLDASSFTALAEYHCDDNEEITSLVNFTKTIDGQEVPYICAGTVVYPEEAHKPVEGRLRIFSTFSTDDKTGGMGLTLVTSQNVIGSVYAVNIVKGALVVAAESAVLLYNFTLGETGPSSLTLSPEPISTWYNNYIVSSLATYDDRIVTGDQISTVSIIKVSEDRIVSHARDYGTLNPVAVEALDGDHLITANNSMNLFTFGATAPERTRDRKTLEKDGGYHVADFVTKLIRGALSTDLPGGTPFIPEIVFCTSSGRVGIILDVNDQDLAMDLSSLQRNLAYQIPAAGGGSHTKFRAPREASSRGDADSAAFGFLDGDFLEMFLTFIDNDSRVEKVYEGTSEPERLKLPVDEYKKVLETLQSLH